MGVLLAGLQAGLLNQPSAQIVDGSLKFDNDSSQYLTRTPSSAGNRNIWTWSAWVKKSNATEQCAMFSAYGSGSNASYGMLWFQNNGVLYFHNWDGQNNSAQTNATFRDTGWYHVVAVHDENEATEKMKFYVNGTLQSLAYNLTTSTGVNDTIEHRIGIEVYNSRKPYDGSMSQCYFIDGQALGSGYFGFTDPLTNTWRPKKFRAEGTTVNDGTVWSSGIPGNTLSGYPATNGFDGNTSNYVYADNGTTMTWTAPKKITGQLIEVYVYAGNLHPIVKVNGQSTGAVVGGAAQQNVWVDVTDLCGGPGGSLQTIQAFGQNIGGTDRSSGFAGVRVDGVTMIDSTTTNLAFGTNGFYLPMDGNSPIGEDKSGKGNNWTPVNFGGSVSLDNPIVSGALPILNTDGGGNVARVGVRTDAYYANLVLALPLNGAEGGTNINDVHNLIKGSGSAKAISIYTGSASGGAVTSDDRSQYYGSSFYVVRGTTNNYTASDYIYRTGDTDLAFGTGDFTVEFWYYSTGLVSNSCHFDNRHQSTNWPSSTNGFQFNSNSSGTLMLRTGSGNIITVNGGISVNSWFHLVITRSSGTIKLFVNGIERGSASNSNDFNEGRFHLGSAANNGEGSNGYYADLRIYKGVSKYTSNFVVASTSPDILPDTPSGVSGSSKLAKVTDGAVSFDGSGDYLTLANSSDFVVGTGDFTMECYIYQKSQGGEATVFGLKHTGGSGWTGYKFYITTSGNFILYAEDAGSGDWDIGLQAGNGSVSLNRWHHLSATRNGTTFRVFVDGILKASTTSSVDLNDGGDGFYISNNGANQQYFNGIISNIRIIKGTALYTTDFTPPTRTLTNVTNTKLLCCQSPTSATEGVVKPGTITANGDAAATNFNPFTTDINAVRGQETGYATLNPLRFGQNVTLSNGNLRYTSPSGSNGVAMTTIPMTSKKYYCEFTAITVTYGEIGICNKDVNLNTYLGGDANGWMYYSGNGQKYNGGTNTSYGATWTNGDVIGIAFDADIRELTYYKNGVSQGVAFTGLAVDEYYFAIGANSQIGDFNFGQKPFKFPPPAGFQPLNAANVKPETVIARPNQYVGVTTYTGENNTRSINIGMKPDLVWFKSRNNNYDNELYDSVRGATNRIYSNTTDAESSFANGLTSFNFNGFSIGDRTNLNGSNSTMVAWTWKAGGNKNTFNVDDVGYASAAAAGLTGGNIAPIGASVGTKQGFSIIKYTGNGQNSAQGIPHGLGKTPSFVITKALEATGDVMSWRCYHQSLGATKYIQLDTTDAAGTFTDWANTSPTSQYFYVGGTNNTQPANEPKDYISYMWSDIPGLQKFGSYEGNESTDGPYVELGFRPAILLVKNADEGSNDWKIYDGTRNPHNVVTQVLYPNAANDEDANTGVDFLSNGFKWRDSGSSQNGAETIIYAAWAEAPAFNLFGGQSNAR